MSWVKMLNRWLDSQKLPDQVRSETERARSNWHANHQQVGVRPTQHGKVPVYRKLWLKEHLQIKRMRLQEQARKSSRQRGSVLMKHSHIKGKEKESD